MDELSRKLLADVELKRVKSELEDANSQIKVLTDAAEKRFAFILDAFHGLRTPLNAIIGFADLIAREHFGAIENPKYPRYAADIRSSGNHVVTIMNDTLSILRLDAGKFHISEELIDIDTLLQRTLRLVPEDTRGQVPVTWHPGAIALPRLYCDVWWMQQTLLKVVETMLMFLPGEHIEPLPGEPKMSRFRRVGKVDISVELTEGLTLIVAAIGIGIRPEDISEFLIPYGRWPRGLPLAKALMEAHGGTLELDSEGDIATVRLRFPSDRIRAGDPATVPERSEPPDEKPVRTVTPVSRPVEVRADIELLKQAQSGFETAAKQIGNVINGLSEPQEPKAGVFRLAREFSLRGTMGVAILNAEEAIQRVKAAVAQGQN